MVFKNKNVFVILYLPTSGWGFILQPDIGNACTAVNDVSLLCLQNVSDDRCA